MAVGSQGRGPRSAGIQAFLIADIRGYTRFTAEHGDEAASRLAAAFAELVGDGVEAWGGDLVELRGDEALAVFDSARSALRCAVELQSAFADATAAEPGLPMRVGIGLDAGEAVPVGDGFRGAALNMAARLCGAAAAGEILASEPLVRLAGTVTGLAFERLPPTALKGMEDPVSPVSVRDASPVPPAADRAALTAGAPTPPTPPPLPADLEAIVPLVGRDAELRWLRWHWRRARHGHGRTVVVSGVPGIGKTRLAAELAAIAHADGAEVRYHPNGRGIAEAPVAPRAALRIVDDLDAVPAPVLDDVARLAGGGGPVAELVLVTHREAAAASLQPFVERLASPERRLRLGPLEAGAIRSIAALYAGRAVDGLPLEDIVTESGGVPAAVHRVAGQRARAAAVGRLGDAVERTEAGRHGLRAAEADLIGNVADLELADERRRLYGADRSEDAPPPVAARNAICPYKGLAAFEAADADYYFGRERLVAELIARFVGSPFVGLVGASGSGKSSAVRAGLLPALAGGVLPGSEAWPQVLMRPGEHPLPELGRAIARAFPGTPPVSGTAGEALDAALASLPPGRQLILAVDQFEEVFGQARDEGERAAFIDLLTADRPGLRVILTIRADHYGHCAPYPALARLLGANQVLVGPLTTAEVASVIEHPAQRVGLRIEPGLTEALVADAGAEPGVLPLLSTALLELWQAREGGRLTLAAYRAVGGLRGAVARLAEAAWAELDPHQQSVARGIFLRLAGPGEGEGVVRRRVPLAELDAERDEAVSRVLERLTAARLLTSGDGYVEVAHEALLREWPRFRGWLDEDETGRRVHLHLIGAVRDWAARGREPGDLYRGARLAAALDFAAEHKADLNAAEREFLEESRLASQRQVERERRTNRRLRGLLIGTALLLVVAIGAGAFALNQAGIASDQVAIARDQAALAAAREADARAAENAARAAEDTALEAQSFARSRELAASAIATLSEDPSLSKLLAVAAGLDRVPDRDVESALHRVFAVDPVVSRFAMTDLRPDDELWTSLHPDGTLFVAAVGNRGPHDRFEVIETTSKRVVWSYTPPLGARVGLPSFTPDGQRLVAGVWWEPLSDQAAKYDRAALGLFIWDARTGALVQRFDTGRCGTSAEAVADRVALIAAWPEDRTDADCFVNDPGSRLDIVSLDDGASKVIAENAAFDRKLSLDGRFVAFSDPDNGFSATVIEVATGRRVLALDPSVPRVQDGYIRALSPDGSLLLYGTRPTEIREVATGDLVATIGGTSGEGGEAAFAPDGRTAYATARDRSLRGWDTATGQEVFVLPAAGSGPVSASFAGTLLVLDPGPRAAIVVDRGARGELGAIRTCRGFVTAGSLTVRADGSIAMFAGLCDDEAEAFRPRYLLDLRDQSVITTYPNHAGQTLEMSPDGARFVGQDAPPDNIATPLRVRDTRTGDVIVELAGVCATDLNLPEEENPGCRPFPEQPFQFLNGALAWSPDGRFIAGVDQYKPFLAVWSAETGALLLAQAPPEEAGFYGLLFSPDSARLIASRTDREIVVFSTADWSVVGGAHIDEAVEGGDRLGFGGFTPDGSAVIAIGGFTSAGGGWLYRMDPDSFAILARTAAHEGSPKSVDLSPDGALVATGASDGVLRIWDTSTLALLHQLSFAGQVQGVGFLDNEHLVVAPHAGNVYFVTIDPSELLGVVARSLTRGFTATECERFGFGGECPTLEELRAAGTTP